MRNNVEEVLSDYKKLINSGFSQRQASIALGIPRTTIQGWLEKPTVVSQEAPERKPKILFYDLETSPSLAYVWGRWKQYVRQDQVVSETNILTYSAKWLGSDAIISNRVDDPEDDYDLVTELYELFEQADVVVAHNGLKFDNGLVNARLVYHGFKPYSPVKFVDTLQIAKKNFRFPSNSLNSLAQYLGIGEKIKHSGFELWKRCLANDSEAFEEMLEYNAMDVVLLEKVYLALRAWDAKAPNMNVYYNDSVLRCPCCGSDRLYKKDKESYTQQSAFDTYACLSCGKNSRVKKNNRSKEAMQNTLVNVV